MTPEQRAPHICTPHDPWTPEKGDRAVHPDAKCVYDGGWEQEYKRYECPHCGRSFRQEIPQ